MKIIQLVVFFTLIVSSLSREISRPENRFVDDSGDIGKTTNSVEPRKHKPYHDLFLSDRNSGFSLIYVNPLHGIAFMGGLQSLVTFVVIKIKIVLVVVTLIGFIALFFKLFGLLKYSGYFYKNDYPVIGPPEYSSYPGPPISGYSSSHHDHDVYGNDWPSHPAESYSRSKKNVENFNVTEIMHSLVNVDKEDCRASLKCELESMLARSPFIGQLTRFGITRQNVPGSRNEDCTDYYQKCVRSSLGNSNSRRKRRELQEPTNYSRILK